jgi:hypothetical protein
MEVEDEASWSAFFADLKAQGLHGKGLKLIRTDRNLALSKFIRRLKVWEVRWLVEDERAVR